MKEKDLFNVKPVKVVGVASGRKQYKEGVFCAKCISKILEGE